jgi:hypothetical protein
LTLQKGFFTTFANYLQIRAKSYNQMKRRYKEYKQLNLTNIGKDILKYWEEHKCLIKALKFVKTTHLMCFMKARPQQMAYPAYTMLWRVP